MRYILDTTVLIDHALGRLPAVELVRSLLSEPNDLLTCDVVVAEAYSAGSDEEVAVIASLVDALEYVAIPPEAARWAGENRRRAGQRSRRRLGDSLIAAAAWFNDATVVTRNSRDFEDQGVKVLAYGTE